ncbi:hypothetical protein A0J61_06587 [Choanephora cucurbitarum]|uniref:Uncharacterized protein n=1 Tax=Choanephora cucurbitarum TaxID=101091 RepID=A0A1C7N8E9_9FUNG|nr:hypothetical protein A0J61_06587 [Choanephora cucurbitarum]
MDEKRLGNTADNVPIAFILLERNPSPPKYEHVIENNPPPPSYMHSAVRLQYHNQPYITDVEQHEFRRQHDMRCASAAEDIQNDTFSTIARLPFRKRLLLWGYWFRLLLFQV